MSEVRQARIWNKACLYKLLITQRMSYFGAGVYPLMNPSGVQLRRCAIHGYAHHINPEALL